MGKTSASTREKPAPQGKNQRLKAFHIKHKARCLAKMLAKIVIPRPTKQLMKRSKIREIVINKELPSPPPPPLRPPPQMSCWQRFKNR